MFNAVNGIGAAGLDDDAYASNAANTTLYATFAVVGFFAGTVTNVLGIRIALSFGGLGYCIYVSALLCFNKTQNLGTWFSLVSCWDVVLVFCGLPKERS